MTTAVVLARIAVPHDRTLELDYHEWVSQRDRLKLDRLCRLNPRMTFTTGTLWVCNNPDCPGTALVHDDAAKLAIIEAEEDPLDQILSHR